MSDQEIVTRVTVNRMSFGVVRVAGSSNFGTIGAPGSSSFGTVRVAGGVPGPPGPPGSSGLGINVQFVSPSEEWLINHNLGYKPVVELFTTGGIEMQAAVIHTSVNQVLVQFNSPQAGSARLV